MKSFYKTYLFIATCSPLLKGHAQIQEPPNVIYMMVDDLGVGDLGCYGQKQIKTPAIDRLAARGVRFAQHYSGSTVSAPSRCSLMTGKHTGNAFIRGNKGVKGPDGEQYDYPLKNDEVTVAEIFKKHDYITACIGKWGMGGPESEGHPLKQGFDYFYGYLGQLNAHRYYPRFLWENNTKIALNEAFYTPYLLLEKTLGFIEQNKDRPFFLYLTPTLPHADLLVPNEELEPFQNQFFETPFTHNHYANQPRPRATYAAMVSRIDKDVERITALLEEKGILDNTIFIFTSDNGVHAEGGHDPDYFDSNGPFRGIKRDLYDGGIRTPFIVQWPAQVPAGMVSFHVSAFWDFLPTVCDLLGEPVPVESDGLSYLPTLNGKGEQKRHDYLYWEFHEEGGKQAVLKDNWKLIKLNVNEPDNTTFELYHLSSDPSEQMDVAKQYTGKIAELKQLIDQAHRSSELFPFEGEK